jgi:hypothetical protein
MVQLKAAACKVDITPKSGYVVESKLYARILLLDADGATAAIVSLDSCFAHDKLFFHKRFYTDPLSGDVLEIPPTLESDARRKWADAVGDPNPEEPQRLFVSATHTHASAPTIGVDATEEIRKAIAAAKDKLRPAKLLLAKRVDPSPQLARLRRPNLKPQTPGAYPIDDTLVILNVLCDPEGALISLIANYGIHGTLWSESNRLSPDFMGEAILQVEEACRQSSSAQFVETIPLFLQGCCGDVGVVYPEPESRRSDYNVVRDWGGYLKNHFVLDGLPLQPMPLRTAQHTVYPTIRPNYGAASAIPVPTPSIVVSGIRFAQETVLLGVSGELFSDYRAKICEWAAAAPFFLPHVIVSGLVNGYSGYIPTRIDFKERAVWDDAGAHDGYEMSVTPYTAAIEEELRAGVTNVLEQLTS